MHETVRNKMTETELANDHDMTAAMDELMKYQDRRQSEFDDAVRQAQQNGTNHHFAAGDLKRAQQALDDLAVLKNAEVLIANMRYQIRQEAANRQIKV